MRCSRELTLPKLLKQNGMKMLAGSDTAVIPNWCIPGFSLHQEFALLAAFGLSPLEILRKTTLNGAQFLGREATMGTADVRKNVDLVLLDANPVADVANLDKISAVVMKGKDYSRAALDKLQVVSLQSSVSIIDSHVSFKQTGQLERPKVNVPDSVVDLFQTVGAARG